MGALSETRTVTAMPEAAIGADFNEPLDAHRNFLAQIALDQTLAFNHLPDAVHFVLAQILNFLHRIHIGLIESERRARVSNSVNVSQRNERPFVTRKIDACNSCHLFLILPADLSSELRAMIELCLLVAQRRRYPCLCLCFEFVQITRTT